MEKNEQNINLIFKYLADETTQDELHVFENLLDTDSVFKENYEAYKKTWELTQNVLVDAIENIDIEKEWQIIKQKTNIDKKVIPLKPKTKFSIWKIAAAIATILVVGGVLLFSLRNTDTVVTAKNSIKNITLPDGSEISLTKNSTLKYSDEFNVNSRKLDLSGEAFFKVSHNKTKPFIVKANSVNIEVVGTEFYVNNNKTKTEVIVNKGIVSVYRKENKSDSVLLYKGAKFIFDKRTKKQVKLKNENQNFISWKTKVFRFDNTSLSEVVKLLNKAYNVKIILKNTALKGCMINTTFEKQSIESILKVLKSMINISVKRKGKIIEISGSCN